MRYWVSYLFIAAFIGFCAYFQFYPWHFPEVLFISGFLILGIFGVLFHRRTESPFVHVLLTGFYTLYIGLVYVGYRMPTPLPAELMAREQHLFFTIEKIECKEGSELGDLGFFCHMTNPSHATCYRRSEQKTVDTYDFEKFIALKTSETRIRLSHLEFGPIFINLEKDRVALRSANNQSCFGKTQHIQFGELKPKMLQKSISQVYSHDPGEVVRLINEYIQLRSSFKKSSNKSSTLEWRAITTAELRDVDAFLNLMGYYQKQYEYHLQTGNSQIAKILSYKITDQLNQILQRPMAFTQLAENERGKWSAKISVLESLSFQKPAVGER